MPKVVKFGFIAASRVFFWFDLQSFVTSARKRDPLTITTNRRAGLPVDGWHCHTEMRRAGTNRRLADSHLPYRQRLRAAHAQVRPTFPGQRKMGSRRHSLRFIETVSAFSGGQAPQGRAVSRGGHCGRRTGPLQFPPVDLLTYLIV